MSRADRLVFAIGSRREHWYLHNTALLGTARQTLEQIPGLVEKER